jgi:hypothetical protein
MRSQTAVEFNSEAMIMLVIMSGSLFLAQSNIIAAVSHSSMPSTIAYVLCWECIFLFYSGFRIRLRQLLHLEAHHSGHHQELAP